MCVVFFFFRLLPCCGTLLYNNEKDFGGDGTLCGQLWQSLELAKKGGGVIFDIFAAGLPLTSKVICLITLVANKLCFGIFLFCADS